MFTCVVMPGDSLSAIAEANSTTTESLLALNSHAAAGGIQLRPGLILRLR
jgi:LysM repeat protein